MPGNHQLCSSDCLQNHSLQDNLLDYFALQLIDNLVAKAHLALDDPVHFRFQFIQSGRSVDVLRSVRVKNFVVVDKHRLRSGQSDR